MGPAAAGKSTCVAELKKKLSQKQVNYLFLSDLNELISLVKKDINCSFHVKENDGRFIITTPIVYDLAVKEMYKKLSGGQNNYDIFILEMACGLDQEGVFDLSLKKRLQFFPKKLIEKTKFVYIQNTLKKRKIFNSKRKKIYKTPKDIFNRLFTRDDFDTIKNNTVYKFCTLENKDTKQNFIKNINRLFDERYTSSI